MQIEKIIQAAADKFVAYQLKRTTEDRKPMLQFVLQRTRVQLEQALSTMIGDDFSIANLDALCTGLDEVALTFAPSVLKSLGTENLEADIISQRKSVKWNIMVNMLGETISDDGKPFNPGTINKLNKELFDAIKAALQRETAQNAEFDWEFLRTKLPADLAARFESGKISDADRKGAIDESTKVKIEELGFSDIIAGLGHDPKKLAYFLDISGLDISETDKNRIIYVSFSGLRQGKKDAKLERLLAECSPLLDNVKIISEVPGETEEGHIRLTVEVPAGAKFLLVRGPWNRDIKLNGGREVSFDVILRPGEENELVIMAYNEEAGTRSVEEVRKILQTGDAINEDALIEFLKALSDSTLENVSTDAEKSVLFTRCIEESLIKHFAGSFQEGEAYAERLISFQKNKYVLAIINQVLRLFRSINEKEYPFIKKGEALMFFQKYCVYRIEQSRKSGGSMILANEPGLGKTVTALAATGKDELLVVCPNSAVSTWVEEEVRFFDEPFLTNLAGYPGGKRLDIMSGNKRRGVLTNIEFVRSKDGESDDEASRTDAKFKLLNTRKSTWRERVTIVDEAHFLKNDSQQTEGVSRLEDDFMLLLTASPFKNPVSLCKVMNRIYPHDARFQSLAAFKNAFPQNDPRALKALYVMVQPHMIRFLKSEVMPTSDPGRPADEQPFALPAKKHISPDELGNYSLGLDQQMAILEMFEDWGQWTEEYDHYMPQDKEAKEDGIRGSDNRLTKEHALRQIMNDPRFIGSHETSPKHQMVKQILEKEIAGGNKVVVFCRYHEQIRAYARMLTDMGHNFSQFTGEVTRQGYKKSDLGKIIRYQVDEFDNHILNSKGKPVEAASDQAGKPIFAIDYERLVFQNDPSVMVCLSTYSAGSQSVTFTAAGAMIKDDLPDDCIRDYQAEDRIHRIDVARPKHEVRYYNLIAKYDREFLAEVRTHMIEREDQEGNLEEVSAYDLWFSQGTLDEVHSRNLEAQKTGFELLNNGISTDPDLVEEETPFNL